MPTRPADHDVAQRNIHLFALVDGPLVDAAGRTAIALDDHDRLCDVVQLAREVAGVRRLQGGVGQALAGPVCRGEVLQDVQAFTEVGADRRLDDLPGGLGHEATHARELLHLADVAPGTGRRHQVNRVEVTLAELGIDRQLLVVGRVAAVVFQCLDQALCDLFTAMRPEVEQLVVPLPLGDRTGVVVPFDLVDFLLGLVEQLRLVGGDPDVGNADGQARPCRDLEAQFLYRVQRGERRRPAQP